MSHYTALTRDGRPWTPHFIAVIDRGVCIGCGRCFKVCGFAVLNLIGLDEDGAVVPADDDDAERKVMTVADGGACVGCGACARVCGKNAQRHAPAEGMVSN